MAVDYGRSILVAGGTASGKTTMLNVLSLFIRPEKKIISIEDTAELYLPHTHWVPSVARTVIAKKPGEVDLFELLRESFRQRPDYIIVGEVRGREAYILFQQIATGHPGLATIHAENLPKLSDRLITKPISLPPSLIGSLDIIVFMARMRYKEKFVRKVTEVIEMVEFDPKKKRPIVNTVFKWNPINDKFEVKADSYVLKKICEQTGISEEELQEELKRRILILRWLKEREITDFREIHKIFTLYYTSPNKLLAAVMGEL
jgi:flagellar protein FlaI